MEDEATQVPGSTAASRSRTVGRYTLAGFLATVGTAHLVVPEPFYAQVPPFLPAPGAIIAVSGVVELGLAGALILLPRARAKVGWAIAAFLVAVFPGNLSQALTRSDAFGLDSDAARWGRLVLQPVMIAWALWATDAWRSWRAAHVMRS